MSSTGATAGSSGSAPTGAFLGRWGASGGDGTPGDGPGEFFTPESVALDDQGDIYVADSGNSRVQKFAGVAGGGVQAPVPRLDLRGRKRQRPARLKAVVGCGSAPCAVELSGRAIAGEPRNRRATTRVRATRFRLKPLTVTLASGETEKVRLKLKRHKRSVARLNRLLGRGARGKAIVVGTASNTGGEDSDRASLKLKR